VFSLSEVRDENRSIACIKDRSDQPKDLNKFIVEVVRDLDTNTIKESVQVICESSCISNAFEFISKIHIDEAIEVVKGNVKSVEISLSMSIVLSLVEVDINNELILIDVSSDSRVDKVEFGNFGSILDSRDESRDVDVVVYVCRESDILEFNECSVDISKTVVREVVKLVLIEADRDRVIKVSELSQAIFDNK